MLAGVYEGVVDRQPEFLSQSRQSQPRIDQYLTNKRSNCDNNDQAAPTSEFSGLTPDL